MSEINMSGNYDIDNNDSDYETIDIEYEDGNKIYCAKISVFYDDTEPVIEEIHVWDNTIEEDVTDSYKGEIDDILIEKAEEEI